MEPLTTNSFLCIYYLSSVPDVHSYRGDHREHPSAVIPHPWIILVLLFGCLSFSSNFLVAVQFPPLMSRALSSYYNYLYPNSSGYCHFKDACTIRFYYSTPLIASQNCY